MCENEYKSENSSLANIYVFEQRMYIKTETIRRKSVLEVHAALNEVYGTDTVNCGTV